jgi:repressor LexA
MARAVEGLTERQGEMLEWSKEYIGEHGISPTLVDIARAHGVAPPSADDVIQQLIRKGYLKRPEKTRRTYQVAGAANAPGECMAVPVRGEIAAGKPIEAVERDDMGAVYVSRNILRGSEAFALKVVGNSMEDLDILDGDVVVVRKQETAENGDVVVALVGGQATLKKLRVRGKRAELIPANRRMKPIKVSLDDLAIQGKLVYVSRAL